MNHPKRLALSVCGSVLAWTLGCDGLAEDGPSRDGGPDAGEETSVAIDASVHLALDGGVEADAPGPAVFVAARLTDPQVFAPGAHLATWPASGPIEALFTIAPDRHIWSCDLGEDTVPCARVPSGDGPTFAPGKALDAHDREGMLQLFATDDVGAIWNAGWRSAGSKVWEHAYPITDRLFNPGAPVTAVFQPRADTVLKSSELFVVGTDGRLWSGGRWTEPNPENVRDKAYPLEGPPGAEIRRLSLGEVVAPLLREPRVVDLYAVDDQFHRVVAATHRSTAEGNGWMGSYFMPAYNGFLPTARLVPLAWSEDEVQVLGIDDHGETACAGGWTRSGGWTDGEIIGAEGLFPSNASLAVVEEGGLARIFAIGSDGAIWVGGSRRVTARHWEPGHPLTAPGLFTPGAPIVARSRGPHVEVLTVAGDGALYRLDVPWSGGAAP